MRLYELSDEEHKEIMKGDWSMPQSLVRWLNLKGLKKLGEGAYSMVYGRPGTNKIVKINKKIDDAYYNFIQYAKDNPNKHFPKVYDLKSFFDVHNLFIFITERLDEYNPSTFELDDYYFKMFCYLRDGDFRNPLFGNITWTYIGMEHKMPDYKNKFYPDELFSDFAEEFSHTEIAKHLKVIFDIGRYDIKVNNLMIRPGTKDLVFSDPIH